LSVVPDLEKAIALARKLQLRAAELQTPQEKRQQRELERMMESPLDKWTLTQMTDQAFRSKTPRRAADQLIHILDVQGVPRFFSTFERALLRGFQSFGGYLPGVSVPMVKEKMREETANVILPAEEELLLAHLSERRAGGVRMNVNFLGEALLGEDDAQRRLESYLHALQFSEIECLSVKISTIYSQISGIARKKAVRVLCDRMELLYRAAQKSRFERADGTAVPKFVYLDMEEYRDLSITLEVFLRTLERPGLEKVNAGIALQAYIPDSWLAQKEIIAWARERRKKGGAPVTIRLVKGANMEAERVEASIRGWPQAPFTTKAETDANYKRMLHEALDALDAVHLGVGTHNLFEVAYALTAGEERGAVDQMQVEMLEGMANHQRRALGEVAPAILLYAPATKQEEFVNAIGYLIRRLDENTGPENFLRWAFKLQVDTPEWDRLAEAFRKSFDLIPTLRAESRRTQDRREVPLPPKRGATVADFVNDPDTDFALPHNVAWVESVVERWKDRVVDVPVVVAGEEILDRPQRDAVDPSRPGRVVARTRQATADDIDRAVGCARRDPGGWRALPDERRAAILAAAAHELRKARGDLIGAAMADGGKIATESDPEISEAVDFVEYYAATARELADLGTVRATPKGVVVVVSPWNFPIAIPCGGVAAGLAAGNCVLLKPASDTVLCAWELCQCFWRAGVPREALQFVPCAGGSVGSRLVSSPDVDVVILTGGTDTALRMLDAAPAMNLLAETGGKNGTIVTAMSDREQAIKHVLHSAFSHSGQKCSATSLLVLEAEVYDDPHFKETLCDAVRSMTVGSAWEPDTRVGPLVRPPSGDLEKGLKDLEDGESWAVMPRIVGDNPGLYSPAVKWGVSRKSYTHMTEFFGPVLSVLRARDLEEAIDLVNDTGYGLTSGLESLDEREQEVWKSRIKAGNLYINRVTTGAIVQRQPFGGYGKSSFGPGIKAGGPNYVAQLMDFADDEAALRDLHGEAHEALEPIRRELVELKDGALPRRDRDLLVAACISYGRAWIAEIGAVHDDQRLVGQDNFRRYLPVGQVRVRVHPDDSPFSIFARVLAARQTGNHVTLSTPPDLDAPVVELIDGLTEPWGAGIELVEETDDELAEVVRGRQTDRIRYAGPDRAPETVLRAVGDTGIYLARAPVLAEGRIELLWYVREQSISHDYHRYGNLGIRADEERRPVD
jgi:RHH-type proline utilization regulon transcriptional repressor/proline dehydrogenase/delta 1-pyrroline-5-carboxylate dehydrogenase